MTVSIVHDRTARVNTSKCKTDAFELNCCQIKSVTMNGKIQLLQTKDLGLRTFLCHIQQIKQVAEVVPNGVKQIKCQTILPMVSFVYVPSVQRLISEMLITRKHSYSHYMIRTATLRSENKTFYLLDRNCK